MKYLVWKKIAVVVCLVPMALRVRGGCHNILEDLEEEEQYAQTQAVVYSSSFESVFEEMFVFNYNNNNYSAQELLEHCLIYTHDDVDAARAIIQKYIDDGTFNFKERALARIKEIPDVNKMSEDEIKEKLAEYQFTDSEISYAISNYSA